MGHLLSREGAAAFELSSDGTVLYQLDPLKDARWSALVERDPQASIFHTVAWLEALNRTYGYTPVAYTMTPPGEDLRSGWVFCRVESWLTGRRLVSLPFSDHCEPLIDDSADLNAFYAALNKVLLEEKLRYIETRPIRVIEAGTTLTISYQSYCFHQLDLKPDLDVLFKALNKDCIQRKIRRAEREQLVCEVGTSDSLLNDFWGLFLQTRRRHQSPPPPKRWFRNVLDCLGSAATLRVAFHGKQPVAAVITLRHKDTIVYKYGCSDVRFNNLGGMPFLFWVCIQEAKHDGLGIFDFGRSDNENTGLITFKDRLGAQRSEVTYTRVSALNNAYRRSGPGWIERLAKHLISKVPDALWTRIGSVVYRHVG